MARVLLPEDVEKGHIPSNHSFKEVTDEIAGRLRNYPGIISVIQIGSTKRQDSNCISDADVVVAYERYARNDIWKILSLLCQSARNLAVPLEFVPLDFDFATKGAHTWTSSFTSHVRWAEGNGGTICGKAITDGIKARSEIKSESLDYAIAKLQKVLKRMTLLSVMDESARYELFTQVVQVPMFLARKVVWDMGIELPLDSKKEVFDAYFQHASNEERHLFEILTGLTRRYQDLVGMRPSREFYKYKVKTDLGETGLEKLILYLEITIRKTLERIG